MHSSAVFPVAKESGCAKKLDMSSIVTVRFAILTDRVLVLHEVDEGARDGPPHMQHLEKGVLSEGAGFAKVDLADHKVKFLAMD